MDAYSDLRITTTVVSTLSFVANLIIIITCHQHERIGKTFSRQLIYYQTLADLIGNIIYMFLSPFEETECNVMGILNFITNLSTVLWTVVMSFVLQMVTNTNQNPIFQANQYFFFYHTFCWILPIILSVIPYAYGLDLFSSLFMISFSGGYGRANTAWCFISNLSMKIILFYVPVWISIIYIAYSTSITTKQVHFLPSSTLIVVSPSPPQLGNISFGQEKKKG
jgi:hypothetical protein